MFYVQSSKRQSTYPLRDTFRARGFTWDKNKRAWVGECDDENFMKSLDRLGLKVTDTNFERSATYRDEFLKNTLPPYHCAYCGKKLTRQTLTVDHLIPVHKLSVGSRRKFYQRLLKVFCHTYDPNSLNNLVCTCVPCNSRKRTKTGFWVIRGKIGNTRWFWPVWRAFLVGVVVLILFYFLKTVGV